MHPRLLFMVANSIHWWHVTKWNSVWLLCCILAWTVSMNVLWVRWWSSDRGITAENMEKLQHTDYNENIRLIKTLVWPVAMNGCESWTLRKNEEAHLNVFEMKGLRKILRDAWAAKKTNEWVLNKHGVGGTVRHCQSQKASILWSHHEKTRELPGERYNARNNTRCTQAKKTTHGLDGQHQQAYVDRTIRGRVNQNDRGQR